MANSASFSSTDVHHIATLANIPVSTQEETAIAVAFDETLSVIANLSTLDTSGVEPAAQTSGLENVWREDVVTPERMFSQELALSGSGSTQNGYFVVERVLHHDE